MSSAWSRLRRTALSPEGRNVSWSTLDYAVMPVAMLIAVPIFIQTLGIEGYGLLALVSAIVSLNAAIGFGFGDTALRFVSIHTAAGDSPRAARIASTVLGLTLASGTAAFLLLAMGAPLVSDLLGLEGAAERGPTLVRVAAILLAFKLTEGVLIAVVRACYRYDRAASVTIAAKITTISIQIGLALTGHGVLALVGTAILVTLVSSLVLFAICWSLLGNVVPRYSQEAFDEFRGFSSWSWLQGINGLVYLNLDRFVITALLGPGPLGIYSACIQIAQNLHYGLAAGAHSVFARISRASSPLEARQTFVAAGRMIAVAAGSLATIVGVFSHDLLELWLGDTVADDGQFVLAALSLSFGWFAANSIITYYTLNGLGLARRQAGVSLGSTVIMVAASSIFIPAWGLAGAALARIPDALFRTAIRVHLGRTIVGGVPWWITFDFPRVVLISVAVAVPGRWILVALSGPGANPLRHSAGPPLLLLTGATCFALTYWVERTLSNRGDEPVSRRAG